MSDMRIEMLVGSAAQEGFILWRDDEEVRFKGKRGISPHLLNALRNQKAEVLAYLKLRDVAGELDWQLGDLLDWYKTDVDMRDIARWDMEQVRRVVVDYIDNFELCRGEGYPRPQHESTDDNLSKGH